MRFGEMGRLGSDYTPKDELRNKVFFVWSISQGNGQSWSHLAVTCVTLY